jgi:hypothetical protein
MTMVFMVVTFVVVLLVTLSAVSKIRRNRWVVATLHDTVGIPFKYFPVLAAFELAGAAGLVAGIWWPRLGIVAALGLVVYFVAAVAFHVGADDLQGMWPAVFMLVLTAGELALHVLTM